MVKRFRGEAERRIDKPALSRPCRWQSNVLLRRPLLPPTIERFATRMGLPLLGRRATAD
jgi:hypothetical protein